MPIGSRVESWLRQLHDPPSDKRRRAAEHLLDTSEFYFYKTGITAEERLEVILSISSLSSDSDPLIRQCIAQLTGLVREWSQGTETLLQRLLDDADPVVLTPAVWATGKLGTVAAPLLPLLVRLARNADREVRWRVPWAISQIQSCTPAVLEALTRLATDEDRTARMYALDAMARCRADGPAIFESVKNAFGDPADEVQCAACRVVGAIAFDWTPIEPELWRLLRRDYVDAVIAICNNWPERIHDPEINAWLQANRGYWWADDYLSGKSRSPLTGRAFG